MANLTMLVQPTLREQLFREKTYGALASAVDVLAFDGEKAPTAEEAAGLLGEADIAITSWGTPTFTAELLTAAPKLKLIVYAAGSVRKFATDAMWDRGVRVCSCAHAIGFGVAEYTVGSIVMGLRNAFNCAASMRRNEKNSQPRRDLFQSTVGVVSLGAVGRQVVRLLEPFGCRVLAYDPHVSADVVDSLGVEMVSLEQLLGESDAVTLHAPNLPQTRKMIGDAQLSMMRDGALLVNTSRGAVIDEAALIAHLEEGRLFAMLDVTDPEPAPADSPLRRLANVFLTPHIAGGPSKRIGEQCLDEVKRFLAGQPQVFEVTRERLATMA